MEWSHALFNKTRYLIRWWLEKIDFRTLLKNRKVIIFLSVFLSIILSNLIYGYHDRVSYSSLMLKNYFTGKGYKGYVQYVVLTHVDNKLHLKLQIAVPYRKAAQAKVLAENTPRILNELIVTMCEKKNKHALSEKRYEELRKHILNVINRFTSEPVENVYYKSILLM